MEEWNREEWWARVSYSTAHDTPLHSSSSALIQGTDGGKGTMEVSGWTEVGALCQSAA